MRPILFIAHSLGGIIVKEALATAHENNIFSSVRLFTYGIMFLGVPHRGTKLANYGTILANIARCYYWVPKNSFLDSLKENSAYNDELNTRFDAVIGWYMFYTFCETLPDTPPGCVVGTASVVLYDRTADRIKDRATRLGEARSRRHLREKVLSKQDSS